MAGKEKKKEFEQLTIPGIDSGEIMLMNDNGKRRSFIEKCELKAKTVCNPIIEWATKEVWDFLQSEKVEINPLYEMGFDRVGCIGCPMAGKTRCFEFSVFPTYKMAYIHAFDKMLEAMLNDGTGRIPEWKNGQEVFDWWMENNIIPGQMEFDDLGVDL